MNFMNEFSDEPSLTEEFRFLCMLHNIGATTPERSLSIEEISKWITDEDSAIKTRLKRLVEMGYVEITKTGDTDKYHVTHSGIRKVLSLYS